MRVGNVLACLLSALAWGFVLPPLARAAILNVSVDSIGSFQVDASQAPVQQELPGLTAYGFNNIVGLDFEVDGFKFTLADVQPRIAVADGGAFQFYASAPLAPGTSPIVWLFLEQFISTDNFFQETELAVGTIACGFSCFFETGISLDATGARNVSDSPGVVTTLITEVGIATPEPAAVVLLATGLLALTGAGALRRAAARPGSGAG